MSTESTTTPLVRPRQGARESQSGGGRANTLALLLGRDSGRHGASMLLDGNASGMQLDAGTPSIYKEKVWILE
ncbi:hypothetical protein L1987_59669 [Smallanthus sonchifolius]|uniref:Uncharacterized protein n=1 Tax=Smallanthus sonchifolius TaxID=185202 RepID=A0ACB9D634_9ASTR|nr:hypothetical protein L1987_59669 [Smallanthus sonchifolius]